MDRASPPPESPDSRNRSESRLDLADLVRALRRRWKLFWGMALGVTSLVMLITLLITPVWESQSSVRVRTERQGGGLGGGLGSAMSEIEDQLPSGLSLPGGLSLPELGGGDVTTEVGVLASRRIVEPVADSLALHVSLSRPWRAYRTDILRVLDAGEDAPEGTYSLRHRDDGTYTVSSRFTEEPVELPDRVEIGRPFRVGPMRFQLEDSLAADPPRTVQLKVIPFREMMREFREDLRIRREDSGSRLVEIQYRHPDPQLARGVVNGILERFLVYSETTNKSDPAREAEILERQVSAYGQRLAEAEAELERFQRQERVVAPEEQAVSQIERIAEVQVEHDALTVERRALTDLLRTVDARRSAAADRLEVGAAPAPAGGGSAESIADTSGFGDVDLETPTSAYRQLAIYPRFISNTAVQSLLQTLTSLENERARLLVRRTRENIDVQMVESRIRDIEEQLREVATDYLGGLETQLASTEAALADFGDQLEAIPEIEIEYARLQRERRLLSEVYLLLQSRLAATRVQEAIHDARLRVVDRGVIEDRPAFPRPEISLALAGALGLMTGLFGVVLVESTNRRVRSRTDGEDAGGAPVIAEIPGFDDEKGPGGPIIERAPWHPASEAIRALALDLRADDPVPRHVMVVGPTSGDGRSTVAGNLAVALARQGMDTALVDADLRSGTLHRMFAVDPGGGWVAAALGAGALADVGRPVTLSDRLGERGTESGNGALDLFPAGGTSTHPLELLTSPRVRQFLQSLRERYDVVVVDTPSLESGHDAAALAPHSDTVLLVARTDRTHRDALAACADRIRRTGASVRGVVLNGVDGPAI